LSNIIAKNEIISKNNTVCKFCKLNPCIIKNVLDCDTFRTNAAAWIRNNEGQSKVEKILEELSEYNEIANMKQSITFNTTAIILNRRKINKLQKALIKLLSKS
jgi:hypothetical protein